MLRTYTHILTPTLVAIMLWMASMPAKAQGSFFYSDGIYEPEWLIEAGIQAGAMNSVTDIMGNPRVYQGPLAGYALKKTSFAGGLYGGVTYKGRIGVMLEVVHGRVQGYDSLLVNATAPSAIGRYDRNLNFRTPITEVALMGQLHLFEWFRNPDKAPGRFSLYAIGGLTAFWYNPQAYTSEGWIDLRPLRLEGQGFTEYPNRKEYGKSSYAWAFGAGMSFDLSSRLTLRLEMVNRNTGTDYIDDVHHADWVNPVYFNNYLSPEQANWARFLYNRSTSVNPPRNTRPRGNPNENDVYWTTMVKVGWNFNRESSNSAAFGGRSFRKNAAKRLRCPNF